MTSATMIRNGLAATLIFSICACGAAANDPQGPALSEFAWPERNPHVLPDARLYDLIAKARAAASEAESVGAAAERLAAEFESELEWETFKPEIVSDGVIFAGRNAPHASEFPDETYVGRMRYESGGEMVGSFKFVRYPGFSTWGFGVAVGSADSLLEKFSGEVAAPADKGVRLSQGAAAFKNGESFVGLFYLYFGDTDALGVYEDAAGARRFVGQLKTVNGVLQPKEGVLEDRSGRLLAVIREPIVQAAR